MATPLGSTDIDHLFGQGLSLPTRVLWLGGVSSDDIGADEDMQGEPGIYWNTARRLILGLHILDTKAEAPITIIMNSCGGEWDHGIAMYDAIRAARSHVTIINMSHARSMTSLIFQAADYRITAPHGFFMIHDGEDGAVGIPKTVYNIVDYSRDVTSPAMYQIYYDRLTELDGKGRPKVRVRDMANILNPKLPKGAQTIQPSKGLKMAHVAQLCGQDTFFTPDEMIQLNFADRLLQRGDLQGAYANPKMLDSK